MSNKRLVIRQLRGDVIANIEIQNSELHISVTDQKNHQAVSEDIQLIAMTPLDYVVQEKVQSDKSVSYVTKRISISFEHELYLNALAEKITKSKLVMLGKRVRAWTEEK